MSEQETPRRHQNTQQQRHLTVGRARSVFSGNIRTVDPQKVCKKLDEATQELISEITKKAGWVSKGAGHRLITVNDIKIAMGTKN